MPDLNDRNLLIELVKSRFKSDKKIYAYSAYIDTLLKKDLPPILSFRHLADIFSLPVIDLYKLSFNTEYFYTKFSIPKRNGGFREISKPYEVLAEIQRWIAKNILKADVDTFAQCVTGYVPEKSIIDHVTPHQKSECLVKFDIKDFFPSISASQVTNIFSNLGYSNSVSRTLAALTTVQGALPQGACTSPCISNLRLANFDKDFLQICAQHKLIYTRYADDIVISGSSHLVELLDELRKIFWQNGFSINDKKTKFYRLPKQTRFVTGLIINNGIIRIPKAMRRKIRAQAHIFLRDFPLLMKGQFPQRSAKQYSLLTIERKDEIYDVIFIERILGKLNYWIGIEPDDEYPKIMKDKIYKMLNEIR